MQQNRESWGGEETAYTTQCDSNVLSQQQSGAGTLRHVLSKLRPGLVAASFWWWLGCDSCADADRNMTPAAQQLLSEPRASVT
jgi:hypothetical protein